MLAERSSGLGATRGASVAYARSEPALQARIDARLAAAQESRAAIQPAQSARKATPANPTIAQSPSPTTAAIQPLQAANSPVPPEPTEMEMAMLSQAIYSTSTKPATLPDGWGVVGSERLAEIGLSPDMLSSQTSDFRAEVYAREYPEGTSYAVVFRGSSSPNDWGANFKQGVGMSTDHYNRALAIGEALICPPGSRITLGGHSLGGGLASTAALAAEMDAITFNAAGLSNSTLAAAERIAGRDGEITMPDISAYYVSGEILSSLQDGGDRVLGGILGSYLGATGTIAGASLLDLPEAVGNRIPLNPVSPDGNPFMDFRNPFNPLEPLQRHQMDYVISSLEAHG